MSKPFVALDFPPWIKWGVRQGAILDQPKSPDGTWLCRWCKGDVPKRRKSWCSQACAKKFQRIWSWGSLSEYIIARDVVCQRCGCEHPGWNRSRSMIRRGWIHNFEGSYMVPSGRAFKVEYTVLSEWWEVDHIVPVKDGGTDDPTNLRTLCHDCHVVAGIEQRRARRLKVAPELAL